MMKRILHIISIIGLISTLIVGLAQTCQAQSFKEQIENELQQIDKNHEKYKKANMKQSQHALKISKQADKRFEQQSKSSGGQGGSSQPETTCDCHDQSVEANTKANNFLYDSQGNRIQRKQPRCLCQSQTDNNNQQNNDNEQPSSSSNNNSNSQTPDFNIHY